MDEQNRTTTRCVSPDDWQHFHSKTDAVDEQRRHLNGANPAATGNWALDGWEQVEMASPSAGRNPTTNFESSVHALDAPDRKEIDCLFYVGQVIFSHPHTSLTPRTTYSRLSPTSAIAFLGRMHSFGFLDGAYSSNWRLLPPLYGLWDSPPRSTTVQRHASAVPPKLASFCHFFRSIRPPDDNVPTTALVFSENFAHWDGVSRPRHYPSRHPEAADYTRALGLDGVRVGCSDRPLLCEATDLTLRCAGACNELRDRLLPVREDPRGCRSPRESASCTKFTWVFSNGVWPLCTCTYECLLRCVLMFLKCVVWLKTTRSALRHDVMPLRHLNGLESQYTPQEPQTQAVLRLETPLEEDAFFGAVVDAAEEDPYVNFAK
ncbi:hypothetical protein BDZ89DRAFT_1044802 [Hymenopellis radicata]|nr:hypothetical protein BDZ89DRAFT_1044802 [Hymenopellis radicata]